MNLNIPLFDEEPDELGLDAHFGGGQTETTDDLFPQEPPPGEPTPTTPAPAIDYAALAAANAAALGPVLQQLQPRQQQQQEPQLTEEEFRQLTKYYRPDVDLVNRLFDQAATPEQRLAALQAHTEGIINHVLATAGLGIKSMRDEFSKSLEPLQQSTQQARIEAFERDLFTRYPSLQQHRQFIPQAVQAVRAAGLQITSPEQALEVTAKMAAALIKQALPPGTRPPGLGAPASSGRSMPRMATMTTGGAAGTPSGGGTRTKKPAWAGVLGD